MGSPRPRRPHHTIRTPQTMTLTLVKPSAKDTPLNINTATALELVLLPGIGPKRAADIIDYRRVNGLFSHLLSIADVDGIGEVIAGRLRSEGLAVARGALVVVPPPERASLDIARPDVVSMTFAELCPDEAVEVVAAPLLELNTVEPIEAPEGWEWTEGQIHAIRSIRAHLRQRRGHMFVLRGYAGTGKTTLLVEALRPFMAPMMIAPTHKARSILAPKAAALGGQASTLASWLGYRVVVDVETGDETFIRAPRRPNYNPRRWMPVVIDEVSMIGTKQWAEIVAEVKMYNLMCVCMGDPLQLPPVNDVEMSPAFEVEAAVELTEVKRASGCLLSAVMDVRRRIYDERAPVVVNPAEDDTGRVEVYDSRRDFLADLFRSALDGVDVICLAWTNAVVSWINARIRSEIVGDDAAAFVAGELLTLTQPYTLDLEPSDDPDAPQWAPTLYTSSRVQVLTAARGVHPFYGDACWLLTARPIGFSGPTSTELYADEVSLFALDDEQRKRHNGRVRDLKDMLRLAHKQGDRQHATQIAHRIAGYKKAFLRAQPGYACTVHKSQGSTFERVFVIQPDICKNADAFERNRLLYVALSRASKDLRALRFGH